MTPEQREELRRRFGLEGRSIEDGGRIGFPGSTVAFGLIGAAGVISPGRFLDIPALISALITRLDGSPRPDFRLADAPEIDRRGFSIELEHRDPALVRIRDLGGLALRVVEPVDSTASTARGLPGDASSVVGDVRDGPFVVLRQDGMGVLVTPIIGSPALGIELAVLGPEPLPIRPLVAIPADAVAWASELEVSDPWLAAEVRVLASGGTSWGHLVAAAAWARSGRILPGEAGQAALRLLRGEIDDRLARPLLWARRLSAAQVETAYDLALAEVDRIDAARGRLEDDFAPQEEWWRAHLRDLFLAREDLECVRGLLRETARSSGPALRTAVEDLDARARIFIAGLPRIAVADERLRRARLGQPQAWWTAATEP